MIFLNFPLLAWRAEYLLYFIELVAVVDIGYSIYGYCCPNKFFRKIGSVHAAGLEIKIQSLDLVAGMKTFSWYCFACIIILRINVDAGTYSLGLFNIFRVAH